MPSVYRTNWHTEDLLLLELISVGNSNKQVAARFHVSEAAIKKRVYRLTQRLNAPNRVALVRAAVEAGLIIPRQRPPAP